MKKKIQEAYMAFFPFLYSSPYNQLCLVFLFLISGLKSSAQHHYSAAVNISVKHLLNELFVPSFQRIYLSPFSNSRDLLDFILHRVSSVSVNTDFLLRI